jgi:raffinose/stachyose/melibiose transport system substrate-binding protein
VFEKVGAQPPQSWGDVMNLVPKFNAAGVAPFSLGGQSRWTNMMWLEFLFDRIGGSDVFQAVADGQQGAWSNPSAIDALTKVQDLVKADGFIKGFSSITADSNADLALLYTDKAAMMLHGSWTYGTMSSDGGDFVSGGNLGYMNFPPVEGGKGDPTATTGNPAQYLSISSKATDAQKETAKKFFATGVLADAEIQDWIGTGGVPIVNGADAKLTGSKDADFLNFVYGVASKAKSFPQSWDQALSPTAAEKLLDNISQLFQLSISPQQFADSMNGVIGQ